MNLNYLREQRSTKIEAMQAIVAAASEANRDLTEDESNQFDTLKTEERSLQKSIDRGEYLAEIDKRSAAPLATESDDYAQLKNSVSVMRVLQAQMESRNLDGIEAEYHQETERRTGRKAEGYFIPMDALETRAPNTTSTAQEIVPAVHRADQYIGPLRDQLVARRLGVRVLGGLSGNITIPKYGSGLTTGWVAENAAVPEDNMSFSNIQLTPKHVGGKTEMSRQLLQQSSPDIESLVRQDLSYLIAHQIDSAIIKGGAANEPKGVLSTTGIQTHSLATLGWKALLQMQEKLETENLSASHWLTSLDVKTKLASTLRETGLPGYLLADGVMAGTSLTATKQPGLATATNKGKLLLGDWSQVLLGVWSELDILVNPFAEPAYTRGGVQVRAMATCDIAVRHPKAFVLASDIAMA